MLQQITVTTKATVAFKPLLKTALQNEKNLLSYGIRRTQRRLRTFEQQFSMSSAKFERKFNTRQLDETLDFVDWLMEIKALSLLQEQYQALSEARID
ncbi:MAG: hypothetical protein KJ638_10960 [Chloroflexi bacterium]|nr:hypothetical protein [Chloroflexota bacterium]